MYLWLVDRLWLSALAVGPCRDYVVAVIGSFSGCDVAGRWVGGYGCGIGRVFVSSLSGPNRGCVYGIGAVASCGFGESPAVSGVFAL